MKKNHRITKLGLSQETLRNLSTADAREVAAAKPGSLGTMCKSYCASCGGFPTWCIGCAN